MAKRLKERYRNSKNGLLYKLEQINGDDLDGDELVYHEEDGILKGEDIFEEVEEVEEVECVISREGRTKTIKIIDDGKRIQVSDGYHTFRELYAHRFRLFIALCKMIFKARLSNLALDKDDYRIWRSKKHKDGSMYRGMFVMGISFIKGKQISYHLPLALWKDTWFAEELKTAPEFDGHTSEDVLKRLQELL